MPDAETNIIKALRIANGLLTDAREEVAKLWVAREEATVAEDRANKGARYKATANYKAVKELVLTLENIKGEKE